MKAAWDRFWFRPSSPLGPLGVRTILCINTLWILLSRPDLPSVLFWPTEMWAGVRPMTRFRYLYLGLPEGVERGLWLLLFAGVAAALFGVAPRFSCALSAILLYHFAPLENVLIIRLGPYFNGLTLPVLGLFILAVAPAPRKGPSSPDYRWPVALIQILFSFNYTFSAVAKIQSAGWEWILASNLREGLMVSMTYEPTMRVFTEYFLEHRWLSGMVMTVAILVDFLFILVPFSRNVAVVLVPLAIIGHIGIAFSFGILFLSAPYLLIYLDWDRLDARLTAWHQAGKTRAAEV